MQSAAKRMAGQRPIWPAAAALVVLAASAFHLLTWFQLAGAGTFRPVDFDAFYTGARIVHDGHGSRLYDLELQARYERALLGSLPLNGNVLPFVSPPHFAVALQPLVRLPRTLAYGIWTVLQLALVAILAHRCWSRSGGEPWFVRVALLAALLGFSMLYVTVYKGQLSLLLLLALLFWADALRRGRDVGVAGWLLVGTLKPQLIATPLLVVVLARRWQALGLFATGCVPILLLSAWVAGPASLGGFLKISAWVDANFDHEIVYPAFMYNFKGLLTLLIGSDPGRILAWSRGAFVGSLLATALLWGGRVDVRDERFDLKLALSLVLALFFTPHLYYYDTLLLAAPAAFFWSFLHRAQAQRWQWVFLLSAAGCPMLFLESAWFQFGTGIVRWPSVLMSGWMLWMGVLLLAGWPVRPPPRRRAARAAE